MVMLMTLEKKTRSGHQPGAAQHIVARDSVDTSDRGSGYYNRKGKAGTRGSYHKIRREKYDQNHKVSEYRDRKCQLCVMHRPAAPMVSWLRAQCTPCDEDKLGENSDGKHLYGCHGWMMELNQRKTAIYT